MPDSLRSEFGGQQSVKLGILFVDGSFGILVAPARYGPTGRVQTVSCDLEHYTVHHASLGPAAAAHKRPQRWSVVKVITLRCELGGRGLDDLAEPVVVVCHRYQELSILSPQTKNLVVSNTTVVSQSTRCFTPFSMTGFGQLLNGCGNTKIHDLSRAIV